VRALVAWSSTLLSPEALRAGGTYQSRKGLQVLSRRTRKSLNAYAEARARQEQGKVADPGPNDTDAAPLDVVDEG
jgi:hypothetical protein